jgi:hypothetical protein
VVRVEPINVSQPSVQLQCAAWWLSDLGITISYGDEYYINVTWNVTLCHVVWYLFGIICGFMYQKTVTFICMSIISWREVVSGDCLMLLKCHCDFKND